MTKRLSALEILHDARTRNLPVMATATVGPNRVQVSGAIAGPFAQSLSGWGLLVKSGDIAWDWNLDQYASVTSDGNAVVTATMPGATLEIVVDLSGLARDPD